MKSINIFLLTRNRDLKICSEYENICSGRNKKLSIKEHEYESLCKMVDELEKNKVAIADMEGVHFSFSISQISKEFDLLKIKKGRMVLNIELKSEMVERERIKKQLLENQYYLKHIAMNIKSFIYVADKNQFFMLREETLEECDISELVSVLKTFEEYDEDISRLFNAKDFLISPLNTPQEFLNAQYFLTDAQKEIRKDIISNAKKEKHHRFLGITGKAGTGKTLLLYDLARNLGKIGPVCIIHCGIFCDGHYFLKNKLHNVNIMEAKELNLTEEGLEEVIEKIKDYRFILVDETQRIYENSFRLICKVVSQYDLIGIFSYDDFQTLSKSEENSRIVEKIHELEEFQEKRLTTKIRTNKEMAAFIEKLLNLNAGTEKGFRYEKIDILCADSIEEGKEIIKYYNKEKNYTFIEYTKSGYHKSNLDLYHGDINTHRVIGQEYDNVIIVMDDNFMYSDDGRLKTREHPNSNYLFYKLFFQGVSRAREKLCIVVVNNSELFRKILNIKYDAI